MGSLLIIGEPGVGKSALLSCLDGHLVVGVEAEQDLPYAGLHQVLHPFLDLSTLPDVRRDALEVVFGLSDGAAPPVQLVGLAALEVLSAAGSVVLVDDRFTGPYEHRILDGIGHNVPQETPEAFTRAVLDVSR